MKKKISLVGKIPLIMIITGLSLFVIATCFGINDNFYSTIIGTCSGSLVGAGIVLLLRVIIEGYFYE